MPWLLTICRLVVSEGVKSGLFVYLSKGSPPLKQAEPNEKMTEVYSKNCEGSHWQYIYIYMYTYNQIGLLCVHRHKESGRPRVTVLGLNHPARGPCVGESEVGQ